MLTSMTVQVMAIVNALVLVLALAIATLRVVVL